jgi:hypothetical protein
MPLSKLPHGSIHPLIRENLLLGEDEDTAIMIDRLRSARRRRYLTKGEFQDACFWKSPRSANHVHRNSHHRIRRATGTALTARSERKRIEALLELRGVSVPTASAILTLTDPKRYGVIDIRVWQLLHTLGLVAGNPKGTKLTIPQWETFLSLIRGLAAAHGTSARNIERALFRAHRKYQDGLLYGP